MGSVPNLSNTSGKLLLALIPVILTIIVGVGMVAPRFVPKLRRIQPVTILLYNHITPTFPQGLPQDQHYYYVTTQSFDEQLKLLQNRGFTFLSLGQYRQIVQNPKLTPKLPVLLVFRDANEDIATYATPILQKYHAPAVVFYQPTSFGKPGFLTSDQINQVQLSNLTVMPANFLLLNTLSARQEVSGTVKINQFEDLLPPKSYDSTLWIILFSAFTLALATFAIVSPETAIVVPILLLPTYLIRFTIFGIPATLLELSLVVVIVSVVAKHLTQLVKEVHEFPYLLQTTIFLFAAALSTYFAHDKAAALGGLKAYVLEPIAFGYILYYLGRRFPIARRIFYSLLISTTAVGLIAFTNYIRGYTHLNVQKSQLATFFGNPNYLASFLSVGILVACFLLIYQERRHISRIGLIGLILLLPGFYFAKSSTAIMGVAIGLGLLLLLRFAKRLALPSWLSVIYITGTILAFLALFLVIANPKIGQKLSNLGAVTLVSRTYIYQTSAHIIQDNPITGVGLENYNREFIQNVSPVSPEQNVALSHNTLLDFWTQMGIFGIFAYLWLVVHFFKNGITRQTIPEMALLLAIMLTLTIHGMLDSQYHKNDYSVIFWTLIGLSAALPFNSTTKA